MNLRVDHPLQALGPTQFDDVAASFAHHTPEFEFRIWWATDYDDLFARTGTHAEAGIETLIGEAQTRGRVMLAAEGGSGKSSILRRLYARARAEKLWPVLIDMRGWSPALADQWVATKNPSARMNLLLTWLGAPTMREDWLTGLPGAAILLVDGLNEVDAETGATVVEVLDEFAGRNPNAGVIVADRLARRRIRQERWGPASIAPISEEQIRVLAGDGADVALLASAFFLDIAIGGTVDSSSGAAAIGAYVEAHSGISSEEAHRAAAASFGVYLLLAARRQQSRTFPLDSFENAAGSDVTARLIETNFLITDQHGTAFFRHHLFHDFLASRWLAADPALWTPTSFDAVTFRASSFDALALTLQQLDDAPQADRFVLRLYDWNYYAVAYSLSRSRVHGESPVSQDTEAALLTMLAEKRWDPIRATAERVTDALRLFPSPMAVTLMEANSLEQLIEIAARKPGTTPEYLVWQDIFGTMPGQPVADDLVERVVDHNALMGWTIANVLRRARLTPVQLQRLRAICEEENDDTIRWRIVHVLGAHPDQVNVDVLFALLDNTNEFSWVRYGAVRALIESAARAPLLRPSIVAQIVERLPLILAEPALLKELEKAVVLREPTDEWADDVEPVIEALWEGATSPAEMDHWSQLAADLRRVA